MHKRLKTTLVWIRLLPKHQAGKLGLLGKVWMPRCPRLSLFVASILFLLLASDSCRGAHHEIVTQLDIKRFDFQRQISTGECQAFRFHLAAGQYLRLRVEQESVDVGIALYQPDGRLAIETEGREDETTTISLLAITDGLYRLEAFSLERDASNGSYKLKVEELRPAQTRDKDRIAGQLAFTAGERLRKQSEVKANREAIQKYEEAANHWRVAEENQERAKALKASGEIYYLLGEPRQALTHYQQAQSFLGPVRSAELESELLSDTSYVYIHLGDYSAALDYGRRANELSQNTGDSRQEALALNCLSEVYYGYGERWTALDYAKQALSIWQRLGGRRRRAMTLLSLGYLYTDLGETQQAISHFDQAIALWRAVNDSRGQALTRAAIASLKAILGESQQALNLYDEARPVIRTAGDRFWEASILQNIGGVYQDLGYHDKAFNYFGQAKDIWQEIESPANEAGTLSTIGWLHHLAGDSQKALANFQQALSVSKALADKKYQSNALRKIGAIYNSLGDKKQALSYYQQALSLHRAGGERQGESYALNEIGKLYQSMRETGPARACFTKALALNRSRGDRFAESETLYQLARVEANRGNLVIARSHIEAALKIIEVLRASVASHELRVTYFASIQQYFEFFVALLMRQHQRQPAAEYNAQALEASERAHARSLLELLAEAGANIRQGADPDLLKQARVLQGQLSALTEKKIKLLDTGVPANELLTIANEIDALSTQRDNVDMLIRSKSPRYAALTQPQPASLKEIQQMLDDDTLLLEYSLGSERSYLWVVSRTAVKSYELPGRARIEKPARVVYELLSASESATSQLGRQREEQYWRQAAVLSGLILKPVAGQLGNKRLLVVADGVLQYIPFNALPIPRNERSRDRQSRNLQFVPLIAEHEIVNLPSASTLAVLRRETAGRRLAPKSVAVLADPVFDIDDLRVLEAMGKLKGASANQVVSLRSPSSPPSSSSPLSGSLNLMRDGGFDRLPGTQREAGAIKEITSASDRLIAMGFDANLAKATSPELSQYRIIHFATHGILDRDNPELSAIVLSLVDRQGKSQNGYLRLHDIYNLNLPAELVVLSACDSGLGKEFKGEGLVGLTRGFMYAGAARVMASLWKVEDEPTARLMKLFYWHLLQDKLSPAAALRKAQRSLWQDDRWHAPYYWAAFVLQGEWK